MGSAVFVYPRITTIGTSKITLFRNIDDKRSEIWHFSEGNNRHELESIIARVYTLAKNNLVSSWRIGIDITFGGSDLHQLVNVWHDDICMPDRLPCSQPDRC